MVSLKDMKLSGLTYTGPVVDDREFLTSLPSSLQEVLADVNAAHLKSVWRACILILGCWYENRSLDIS